MIPLLNHSQGVLQACQYFFNLIIIYPPSLIYKKFLKRIANLHTFPLSNHFWCGPLIFYCGSSFNFILSLSLCHLFSFLPQQKPLKCNENFPSYIPLVK